MKKGEARGLKKGEAKGLKEGLAEGERKNALETAKKMKARGMNVNEIAELTGLPADDVLKL